MKMIISSRGLPPAFHIVRSTQLIVRSTKLIVRSSESTRLAYIRLHSRLGPKVLSAIRGWRAGIHGYWITKGPTRSVVVLDVAFCWKAVPQAPR